MRLITPIRKDAHYHLNHQWWKTVSVEAKPYKKVAQDGERDYWMNAQEALEYGMVDEILRKRK